MNAYLLLGASALLDLELQWVDGQQPDGQAGGLWSFRLWHCITVSQSNKPDRFVVCSQGQPDTGRSVVGRLTLLVQTNCLPIHTILHSTHKRGPSIECCYGGDWMGTYQGGA